MPMSESGGELTRKLHLRIIESRAVRRIGGPEFAGESGQYAAPLATAGERPEQPRRAARTPDRHTIAGARTEALEPVTPSDPDCAKDIQQRMSAIYVRHG